MDEKGGDMVLVNVGDSVREILEIANILPMIEEVPSEADAFARWGLSLDTLPAPRILMS